MHIDVISTLNSQGSSAGNIITAAGESSSLRCEIGELKGLLEAGLACELPGDRTVVCGLRGDPGGGGCSCSSPPVNMLKLRMVSECAMLHSIGDKGIVFKFISWYA